MSCERKKSNKKKREEEEQTCQMRETKVWRHGLEAWIGGVGRQQHGPHGG